MANKIRVDTEYLSRWASQLTDVSEALTEAARDLGNVDTSDGWWRKVSCSGSVRLHDEGGSITLSSARSAVSQLENTLKRYYERVNKLSGAVRQAGINFDNAETNITSIINGTENNPASEVYSKETAEKLTPFVNALLDLPEDPSKWTEEQRRKYDEAMEKLKPLIGPNLKPFWDSVPFTPIIGTSSWVADVINKLKDNKIVDIEYETRTGGLIKSELGFDSTIGKGSAKLAEHDRGKELYEKKEGDGTIPKRAATILEVGIEGSKSVSWKHDEGEISGKYGSAGASYDIGKAEVHSSLHAGLYVTKTGPDGKKIKVLEPGVSAEIGGSVSGIEAEMHGQLGNDNLGLSGKVNASALKAEASAKTELGFVDGKPSARVSANAEAILGEIEGEAAVHIAGAEGKITGGVNFGIGAHADVGYSDGKFVVDIGASVGVGASVKVELDVGGLVDNVGNVVENVWEASQDTIDAARGYCESFMDNAAKNLSNWWKW